GALRVVVRRKERLPPSRAIEPENCSLQRSLDGAYGSDGPWRMGIFRPSSFGLFLAIGTVALVPSTARADKVLVFQHQVGDTSNLGGDLAGPNAASYLRGKG